MDTFVITIRSPKRKLHMTELNSCRTLSSLTFCAVYLYETDCIRIIFQSLSLLIKPPMTIFLFRILANLEIKSWLGEQTRY